MKTFIIFVSAYILSFGSYAQLKTKEVFNEGDMVWYGLDFSKSKFVGDFESIKGALPINSNELVNKYIPGWNQLIVNEPANFDLKSAFQKKNVIYDMAPVESLNAKIPTQDLITMNSNSISSADLSQMILNYKSGIKTSGLGLVFIVESFDKTKILASLWVVFFDIETKKILLSKHCEGKPAGFGLRNYWAGSIKNILNQIKSHQFSQWSKEATSLSSSK